MPTLKRVAHLPSNVERAKGRASTALSNVEGTPSDVEGAEGRTSTAPSNIERKAPLSEERAAPVKLKRKYERRVYELVSRVSRRI